MDDGVLVVGVLLLVIVLLVGGKVLVGVLVVVGDMLCCCVGDGRCVVGYCTLMFPCDTLYVY